MQFFPGETPGVGGNATPRETISLQSPLFHNIAAITPDRIAHAAHYSDILVQAHPESHILSGPIILQQTNGAAEIIIPTRLQSQTQEGEQPITRFFSDEKIAEKLQAKGVNVQEDQIISSDGRILAQLIPQEHGANFVIRVNTDLTNDQDLTTPTTLQQELSQAFAIYQTYVAACFDAIGQEMPYENMHIAPFLPEPSLIMPSPETTLPPTEAQNTHDMQEPEPPSVPSSDVPSDEHHTPNPQAPSPTSPHYGLEDLEEHDLRDEIHELPQNSPPQYNSFLERYLGQTGGNVDFDTKSFKDIDLGDYFGDLGKYFKEIGRPEFPRKGSNERSQLIESLRNSGIIVNPKDIPKERSFEDLEGQTQATTEFTDLKDLLINPDSARRLDGVRIPRGRIVTGPPGTGKSTAAEALISEVTRAIDAGDTESKHVVFMHIRSADIMKAPVGETPAVIRGIFELAQEESRDHDNCPVVIIMDEAEAVLAKQREGVNETRVNAEALSMFREYMEGVLTPQDIPIMLLAITNYPEYIEGGIMSRFGAPIEMNLPKTDAYPKLFLRKMAVREALMNEPEEQDNILQATTEQKPRNQLIGEMNTEDIGEILKALNADFLSGRDFEQIADILALTRRRRRIATGNVGPLTRQEILDAIEQPEGAIQRLLATRKAQMEEYYTKHQEATQSNLPYSTPYGRGKSPILEI